MNTYDYCLAQKHVLLNAINEMNRKKLKAIEFFYFLLAIDLTKPVWMRISAFKKAVTKNKERWFRVKKFRTNNRDRS